MIVTVRGLPTYVEIAGEGPPVLYLHGAAEWAGYSDRFVSRLAQHFRIIKPERRGHGQTPDPPAQLSFAEMTTDTIALIAEMDIERAHLVGFSDGAIPDSQLCIIPGSSHELTVEQSDLVAKITRRFLAG